MSCSGRRHFDDIKPEQKWDFISLNDFKSTSCLEPFAYGYLWGSLVVSVAVYGIDTYTAVQLIAFNKWSSQISPAISLDISRWIFAICIILSWANLGYEYWRAARVIKREAVAESYLDSLAVRLQSIRMGKNGRGWRRFLVFAALTKSKKGAEYVALFTYFSFQAWIRVIFCSGPRQVVNALTLWAVFQAKLDPKAPDAGASIIQFFKNISILAGDNKQQAVILSGMLFTLIIWAFAALSLLLALLFYLLFLWHYIPNSDRGLSGYCERKINSRLTRIVSAKVNKALEDEERKKLKEARRAVKKGEAPALGRQATLPTLFDAKSDDKLPEMPMLNRNDTMSTLPLYTSRPGTPSSQQPTLPGFELGAMDQRRPFPSRTGTASSSVSITSNTPLMGAAGEMGYGRTASPAPTLPPLDTSDLPLPQRSMTANSNSSQWQRGTPQSTRNGPFGPPSRQVTQDSYSSDPRGPPSRQMTQDGYFASPTTYGEGRNSPRPQGNSVDSYGRPLPRAFDELSGRSTPGSSSVGRRTPFADMGPGGRPGPAPGSDMGRSSPAPSSQMGPAMDQDRDSSGSSSGSGPRSPLGSGGYVAYNPAMRSASAGISSFQPQQQRPYRNMTEPVPVPSRQPPADYFGSTQPPRQGTPQSQRGGYNNEYNAYPGRGNGARGASPASFDGRPAGQPQQGGYRR